MTEISRVLIVGFGSIGKRHARILRETYPGVSLAVLRRPGSKDHSDDIDLEGISQFHEIADALAFAPQAAVIATPAPMHVEIAMTLLDHGIHLLIEKPLAHSSTGLENFIARSAASGLTVMTGYNLRFTPSLDAFKRFLANGQCGEIFSVRAEVGQNLRHWRPGTDYKSGVSAKRETGGGVLLELSHEVDYLQWIFGKISWVKAIVAKTSNLDIEVEDTAHLIVGQAFPGREQALITRLDLDFIRQDFTRTCVAIGESGTLKWDGVMGRVTFFSHEAGDWHVIHETPDERDLSFSNEWRHFMECIENSGKPLISLQDGLSALQVIEAARLSSTSGKTIEIPH